MAFNKQRGAFRSDQSIEINSHIFIYNRTGLSDYFTIYDGNRRVVSYPRDGFFAQDPRTENSANLDNHLLTTPTPGV